MEEWLRIKKKFLFLRHNSISLDKSKIIMKLLIVQVYKQA